MSLETEQKLRAQAKELIQMADAIKAERVHTIQILNLGGTGYITNRFTVDRDVTLKQLCIEQYETSPERVEFHLPEGGPAISMTAAVHTFQRLVKHARILFDNFDRSLPPIDVRLVLKGEEKDKITIPVYSHVNVRDIIPLSILSSGASVTVSTEGGTILSHTAHVYP